MSLTISIDDLLDYTDWQRSAWQAWFESNPAALDVSTGPNTDGRFPTLGALIRHIFSAELRYIERLRGLPLTDTSTVPTTPSALFDLGAHSRQRLRGYLATDPPPAWERPVEMTLLNRTVWLTARQILLHTVTHEIRHWAQVGTMLRQQGWTVPPQDLLLAPVAGPALQPEPARHSRVTAG